MLSIRSNNVNARLALLTGVTDEMNLILGAVAGFVRRFLNSVFSKQELPFIIQVENPLIRLGLGNGHEGDVGKRATGLAGRFFDFLSDCC